MDYLDDLQALQDAYSILRRIFDLTPFYEREAGRLLTGAMWYIDDQITIYYRTM